MIRKDATTPSSIIFVTSVVYVSFFLYSAITVTARGFSMKMIHSDSKESPLYRGDDLTRAERLQGLVKQSKARAHHFGSKASYNESSINPDIVHVPVGYDVNTHFYLGQVGIGNFRDQPKTFMDYYLIIDTGSDLTWTQCQGASSSFDQDFPLYPYQDSSTYFRISCVNDSSCSNICGIGSCKGGYCSYREEYVTGQVTSGDLALETLTISSDNGAKESFQKIIMGCGFEQRGFGSFQVRGKAKVTGVLGLGQGDFLPLVRQIYNVAQDKFEYCLEPFSNSGVGLSHTYLRFGSDGRIGDEPEAVLSTPIIKNAQHKTPYYLSLEDISVANISAGFRKKNFKIRPDGSGGSIIDSGSRYSVLKKPHFEKVKELVVQYFLAKGIHTVRVDSKKIPFDPCFRIPDGFRSFPSLTFHFQEADFVIDHAGGIFTIQEDKIICFGILGGDSTTDLLLGAMQQTNKRISYDLDDDDDGFLSFREEDCTTGS